MGSGCARARLGLLGWLAFPQAPRTRWPRPISLRWRWSWPGSPGRRGTKQRGLAPWLSPLVQGKDSGEDGSSSTPLA